MDSQGTMVTMKPGWLRKMSPVSSSDPYRTTSSVQHVSPACQDGRQKTTFEKESTLGIHEAKDGRGGSLANPHCDENNLESQVQSLNQEKQHLSGALEASNQLHHQLHKQVQNLQRRLESLQEGSQKQSNLKVQSDRFRNHTIGSLQLKFQEGEDLHADNLQSIQQLEQDISGAKTRNSELLDENVCLEEERQGFMKQNQQIRVCDQDHYKQLLVWKEGMEKDLQRKQTQVYIFHESYLKLREKEEESKLCAICWNQESKVMLIPCGHLKFCQECVPREGGVCSLCKATILKTVLFNRHP